MKLLHFSTEKEWRGGEQQIAYLITELKKKGHDNFLLCRRNSEMERFAIAKKLPYLAISISNSIDFRAIINAVRIFRREKPAFIHLHSSKAHSIGLFANLFCRDLQFILHRRVSFKIKRNKLNHWKYTHPAIKKIVCISQDVRKEVLKIVRQKEKTSIIYSGVDLEKFKKVTDSEIIKKELGLSGDKIIVTGVGALSPEKDFSTFLHVARKALLQNTNIHFLIVGKGPEENKLKNEAIKLRINKNVTFTGFKKDIPSILCASDIFMLCSKSEGLGTSFLDAFACKLPVIATKTGGVPEIVIHEKTGLLAEPGSAEEVSKHLLKLCNDPRLRKKLGEKAHEFVQKFSTEQMAQQHEELYHRILK